MYLALFLLLAIPVWFDTFIIIKAFKSEAGRKPKKDD